MENPYRPKAATGGPTLPMLHHLLCSDCCSRIPWITDIRCKVCGRYETCPDCKRRKGGGGVINRSAVRYDPFMKELLARYKYRGAERLEPIFAQMIGYAYELLADELTVCANPASPGITVVSYVPLSRRRLEERGFNQAERLAVWLSRERRLPVLPLLERTRHTEKMSYKSRKERLESLDQAFGVPFASISALEDAAAGKQAKVLLVDDVYTTGSTLNKCAEEIVESCGKGVTVFGLTWAR
jgi:competence protein ComFC